MVTAVALTSALVTNLNNNVCIDVAVAEGIPPSVRPTTLSNPLVPCEYNGGGLGT